MGRIYLVRHGEVDFNRANAYIGRTDLPLNETGLTQARLLANYLTSKDISQVYSSTLARSAKTAEIVAEKLNLPVTRISQLRELDYGDWEGVPQKIVAEKYGEVYTEWHQRPLETRVPGGESIAMLIDRIQPVFQAIAESCRNRNVVIVGHKCVNRVLLCLALDIDPTFYRQIGQANAAINILEAREDGRIIVERINDTCHLTQTSVLYSPETPQEPL